MKDHDEDSSCHRKVIESRGWWKPGTSRVRMNITSESQTELTMKVRTDVFPTLQERRMQAYLSDILSTL